MAFLLATIGTDADYMPAHLYALRNELPASAPTGPELWGVGYYADDRALVIKKPSELLRERTAYELASEVKSRVIVACSDNVRVREQAPPFRFRRWLFGSSGNLAPLGAMRERIVDRLPDFVRSELGHKSDGELAFSMFLAELFRSGKLDDPLATQAELALGLRTTAETIARLGTEQGAMIEAAYVVTNGRSVMVCSTGTPIAYKVVEGLERLPDGPPDPAMTDFKQLVRALKRFRAVVIAAEVPEGTPNWTAIPAGRTLLVDRQLDISTHDG